jgi:DNA-binding XRE family transcriptional regulator
MSELVCVASQLLSMQYLKEKEQNWLAQNQDNLADLLHVTSQNQDNLADLLHVTSHTIATVN